MPNSLSSCLMRVVMFDGTQCNCSAAWATLPVCATARTIFSWAISIAQFH
ncbi:hypothetical protein P3S72_22655 [Pseudomonas sp. D3]|nr:hypothetical protein [Pseudomonas sp. D3]WET13456.1 hypothetical protein P3S72_22655 [Pseudomonas sp. D3]